MSAIPGFAEAVAQEAELRDVCFFDLPEMICGFEVKPLTARIFSVLCYLKNPFVCGGIPNEVDTAQFMWAVSPQYDPSDTAGRDALTMRVDKCDPETLVAAIRKYVDDALMDMPGGAPATGAPVASFVASLVHVIASEYGWSEWEILDLPLRKAFQYLRLIIKQHDPDAPLINRSDIYNQQWAQKETERLQAEKSKVE